MILYVLVLVLLPVAALNFLSSMGIAFPVTVEMEVVYGLVLSVLLAARYVLQPTRAYGPICIAIAAATMVFLVVLVLNSTYHFLVPGTSVEISATYTDVLLLLLFVPAFALCAGIVTTVEDWRSPSERLEFDYPA
jgi:hypothetical protein